MKSVLNPSALGLCLKSSVSQLDQPLSFLKELLTVTNLDGQWKRGLDKKWFQWIHFNQAFLWKIAKSHCFSIMTANISTYCKWIENETSYSTMFSRSIRKLTLSTSTRWSPLQKPSQGPSFSQVTLRIATGFPHMCGFPSSLTRWWCRGGGHPPTICATPHPCRATPPFPTTQWRWGLAVWRVEIYNIRVPRIKLLPANKPGLSQTLNRIGLGSFTEQITFQSC